MRVISGQNVNDIWPKAIQMIVMEGDKAGSRNGLVLVHPYPVTTVYEKPRERVIFDPVRDANPFFHLHEALWMLAGRDDATWLDRFIKDFSSRFAEDGGRMHGAYGKRWRGWFRGEEDPVSETYPKIDQLNEVVRLLKNNQLDRQALIQMWDPSKDLGVPNLKDRPCNQQVLLRADRGMLDMTVTCRSNDMVYGAYGANVVHFSILQEYLAARIGVPVGRYYQVSNNFHMYDWSQKNVDLDSALTSSYDEYPGCLPLVDHPESFDQEVKWYIEYPGSTDIKRYKNSFFFHTAQPMFLANEARRDGNMEKALSLATTILAPDWRKACVEWLERRVK